MNRLVLHRQIYRPSVRLFSTFMNANHNGMTSEELSKVLQTPMLSETKTLAEKLIESDRVALSKSITLIESTNLKHHVQAQHLLEFVLKERASREKLTGENEVDNVPHSFRLGIAGPPGAGKSTFIEALGEYLLGLGHRVAVIAVDPSSTRTGGSILGDKTRMINLVKDKRAYVRPSPTRGHLGGVAQHSNEVVLLCEAAKFDIVIVETVGLGQSEVMVDDTVDMLLLLVPPAGGDELQGVKKGIMEVADMVVVNKADGKLLEAANHTATEYMHAFQVFRRKRQNWRPRVKMCSALHKEKIDKVWEIVQKFQKKMNGTGEIALKRSEQGQKWMWSELGLQLMARVRADQRILDESVVLQEKLAHGHITPRQAAKRLIDLFCEAKK